MKSFPSVLVTRQNPEGPALQKILESSGFLSTWLPMFELSPLKFDLSLEEGDALIFMSRFALRQFAVSVKSLPQKVKFFSVGSGTASEFKKFFPREMILFPLEESSEGLLPLLLKEGDWHRALIFQEKEGRKFLMEQLSLQGRKVFSIPSYEKIANPEFPSKMRSLAHEIVLLSSTENLNFFLSLPKPPGYVPWITVLPGRMEDLARERGYSKLIPLHNFSHETVLSALQKDRWTT